MWFAKRIIRIRYFIRRIMFVSNHIRSKRWSKDRRHQYFAKSIIVVWTVSRSGKRIGNLVNWRLIVSVIASIKTTKRVEWSKCRDYHLRIQIEKKKENHFRTISIKTQR